MTWEDAKLCPNPAGLAPCKWCGAQCMETEEIKKDMHGRGRVIRITATCEAAMDFWLDGDDKDAIRTEFAPPREAVKQWNKMMREK